MPKSFTDYHSVNGELMVEGIAELENRIQCLELENQYLKNLLTAAGISYASKDTNGSSNEYDPDQGSRIIPRKITETDAKVFFSMFWGRTDVYSKRTRMLQMS